MRKMIFIIAIITLSACTSNNVKVESIETTSEKLSLRIEELNEKIVSLDEQVLSLTNQLNMPEVIHPIDYDERLLYVNSLMPFAVSIVNKENLPLVVYEEDSTLLIYYVTDEVTQFIEAYSIKPSILIKENNVDPDYYDKKQVVKIIDNDWVIVRIISIETSLDQITNDKIHVMLDDVKFY